MLSIEVSITSSSGVELNSSLLDSSIKTLSMRLSGVSACWLLKYAKDRLDMKKAVASIAVALEKKFDDPCEPNTVPDAPEPNAAPASAPLPL